MISVAELSTYDQDPGLAGIKKTLRKIEVVSKPYYGTAIRTAGVAFAPFTGGTSLIVAEAAAGGLEKGMSIRAQKKAGRRARKIAAIEDSMFAAEMMDTPFPVPVGPTPAQKAAIMAQRIAQQKAQKRRKELELTSIVGAGALGLIFLALALKKR